MSTSYRQLTASATAGNVDTDFTPRTGKSMQVKYGQVVLTTDATVANRRVVVQVLGEDGSSVIADFHTGAVVAASATTQHHEFMQGIFRETSFIGGAIQVPIPVNCIIPNGYTFRVTVENGVAGDSYTTNFLVESDS